MPRANNFLVMGKSRCIYTLIMTLDPNSHEAKTRQVAVGCSCGNLRRASRAVTQLYDGVLQPSGLKATQFTLLVAAAELKAAPVSRMAEVAALPWNSGFLTVVAGTDVPTEFGVTV